MPISTARLLLEENRLGRSMISKQRSALLPATFGIMSLLAPVVHEEREIFSKVDIGAIPLLDQSLDSSQTYMWAVTTSSLNP